MKTFIKCSFLVVWGLMYFILGLIVFQLPKVSPIDKFETLVKIKVSYVSHGSGIVIHSSDKGSVILTNKHVCVALMKDPFDANFQFAWLKFYKDETSHLGDVLKLSQKSDLCLMGTYTKQRMYYERFAEQIPEMGEPVTTYSHPADFEYVKTAGFMGGELTHENHKFRTASSFVYLGSSGSGLYNDYGELIGVTSMVNTVYAINIFVPLDQVQEFLNEVGDLDEIL